MQYNTDYLLVPAKTRRQASVFLYKEERTRDGKPETAYFLQAGDIIFNGNKDNMWLFAEKFYEKMLEEMQEKKNNEDDSNKAQSLCSNPHCQIHVLHK